VETDLQNCQNVANSNDASTKIQSDVIPNPPSGSEAGEEPALSTTCNSARSTTGSS
jgi:hypothetical protein